MGKKCNKKEELNVIAGELFKPVFEFRHGGVLFKINENDIFAYRIMEGL